MGMLNGNADSTVMDRGTCNRYLLDPVPGTVEKISEIFGIGPDTRAGITGKTQFLNFNKRI
eukprot:SAG11_NODE_1382_length_5077_cov_15.913620_4_plen_61_part_00